MKATGAPYCYRFRVPKVGGTKVYPRCTQGVPKVYPRCTQGVPKVYPRCTQGGRHAGMGTGAGKGSRQKHEGQARLIARFVTQVQVWAAPTGTSAGTGLGTSTSAGLGSSISAGLGTSTGTDLGTRTSAGLGSSTGTDLETRTSAGLGSSTSAGLGTSTGAGLGTSTGTGLGSSISAANKGRGQRRHTKKTAGTSWKHCAGPGSGAPPFGWSSYLQRHAGALSF